MTFPGLLLIPLWIIIFILLLVLLLFIFWVWAIIDCLNSKLSVAEKLFWLIIIVIFNVLGALLYYIFSKVRGESIMKTKTLKGKKLLRSRKNRIIAGICGGIGEYLGIDPTVIRLLWVLFTVFSMGSGILAYIIAWIIIPEEK